MIPQHQVTVNLVSDTPTPRLNLITSNPRRLAAFIRGTSWVSTRNSGQLHCLINLESEKGSRSSTSYPQILLTVKTEGVSGDHLVKSNLLFHIEAIKTPRGSMSHPGSYIRKELKTFQQATTLSLCRNTNWADSRQTLRNRREMPCNGVSTNRPRKQSPDK